MPQGTVANPLHVLVIGAGQAGLAAGYFLRGQGRPYLILEAHDQVGASWSRRWDTLRLFSPAGYNDLPGMPFPRSADRFPSKDQVAAYFQAYVARFGLPVQLSSVARSLSWENGLYVVDTGAQRLHARHVIVATGAFQKPRVPAFASDLAPAVWQSHSSAYHNPAELPPGPALVVGTGNSGCQIAMELAATRETWLSGGDTGYMPRDVLGIDIYWWLRWTGLLTARHVRWGAGASGQGASGDVRVGITPRDLDACGIHRVPRTASVRGGRPVLADGRVLDIASVIWCTGYAPDFGWIQLPVFGTDGYPQHRRGVVSGEPGLYFVGLRYLDRLNSSLIGGVGADAAYVTKVIAMRMAGLEPPSGEHAARRAAPGVLWHRLWKRVLLGRSPRDDTGRWSA